jgi:hypothetical protein
MRGGKKPYPKAAPAPVVDKIRADNAGGGALATYSQPAQRRAGRFGLMTFPASVRRLLVSLDRCQAMIIRSNSRICALSERGKARPGDRWYPFVTWIGDDPEQLPDSSSSRPARRPVASRAPGRPDRNAFGSATLATKAVASELRSIPPLHRVPSQPWELLLMASASATHDAWPLLDTHLLLCQLP